MTASKTRRPTRFEADLTTNARYTWQARAEGSDACRSVVHDGVVHRAGIGVPRDSEFADPLTNGRTVGVQHGGVFIAGPGLAVANLTDGIDYDLTEPCVETARSNSTSPTSARKEGLAREGLEVDHHGRRRDFGDFAAFRDHPWKMHLISAPTRPAWRSSGGTATPKSRSPGDHRIKLRRNADHLQAAQNVYRFRLEWATTGFRISSMAKR